MLLVVVLAPVISESIVQLGARVFADAIRHHNFHGDCLQASELVGQVLKHLSASSEEELKAGRSTHSARS